MKYLYPTNTLLKTIGALALCAGMAIVIHACKKSPADNVRLVVNTDLIKYSVLVDAFDASNPTKSPANVKLSISGPNGDMIYEISGKKTFTMHDGEIAIGLHPAFIPTTGAPAKFNVELSAAGYLPVTQEVIIKPNQKFQALKVKMFNLGAPPAGYYVEQKQFDASTTGLTSTQVIKVRTGQLTGVSTPQLQVNSGRGLKTNADPTYYDDALTSVVLPAGTTFYYYKTINELKTGTRKVPVYGEPVTLPQEPNIPVSITGGTITVKPITYTPIISYYDEEFTYVSTTYKKVPYSGPVNATCIYSRGDNKDVSVFTNDLYQNHTINALTNSSVSENELLFTSAVLQKLDKIIFVGKVDDQDITISPDKSAAWTTSYALDPAAINPVTQTAIKAGDNIEIGIDYTTGITQRTTIVKTADGRLRAQSQSLNIGYFYKAPYVSDFNFTIKGAVDPLIPDMENVAGVVSLNLGAAGGYNIGLSPNVDFSLGGKIASKNPVPINGAYSASYFASTVSGNIANGATISPFKQFTGLQPLVKLNVSVTCTGDPGHPITIRPTGSFRYTLGSINGDFNVNMVNGSWSTRGLTLGQQLSRSLYVGTSIIEIKTDPLHVDDNNVAVTLGYKDNLVCKTY